MKTIETTVYTYAELLEHGTPKAVDAAKQWLSEANTDHDWWDAVYEMWKAALDQVGFENADISFSGFWSQGDGASFTAKLNIEKLIAFLSTKIEPSKSVGFDGKTEDFLPYVVHKIGGKTTEPEYKRLLWAIDYLSGEVTRTSHHYSHENTCKAVVDFGGQTLNRDVLAFINQFEADIEQLRRDLSQVIYRSLEAEYEDLTGDECIEDFAEANGYTFTIAGRRFG